MPAAENGAVFLLQGFDALKITDADRKSEGLPVIGLGNLPPPGSPLSPKMKAAMSELVERNQAAWELFQKAASCERSRYEIDLNNLGLSTVLTHPVRVKTMTQWAKVATIVYANEGKSRETADAILVSLGCANTLRDEPVFVSQMVLTACYTLTLEGLEWALSQRPFDAADLERISVALARLDTEISAGTGLTRAYAVDRLEALEFAAKPLSQQAAAMKEYERWVPLATNEFSFTNTMTDAQFQKYSQAQYAFLVETFAQILQDRSRPFPERTKSVDHIRARYEQANTNGLGRGVVALFLPGLEKIPDRELRLANRVRLARIGVALEQFRLAHARTFPDSLRVLSPQYLAELPLDPYNGEDFNYRKDGKGYRLFGNNPAWLNTTNDILRQRTSFSVTLPPP